MKAGRHYLISHLPGEHDNPDGRIAEDCRVAAESAVVLGHSLFYSILLLIGFTQVLWSRSGVVTLDLGFAHIPIYGHLVWIAIIYSALASWLGWLVSRPLTGATNARQSAEANFRASLLEAQENSQAIALIHAESCERHQFRELFRKLQDGLERANRGMAKYRDVRRRLCRAFHGLSDPDFRPPLHPGENHPGHPDAIRPGLPAHGLRPFLAGHQRGRDRRVARLGGTHLESPEGVG